MGLNEDILRFMTIRIEEVDEEPSIMDAGQIRAR